MPDKDSPAPGNQPKLAFAGRAGNPRPAISLHEEKKDNTEENETRAPTDVRRCNNNQINGAD
jgi:hypothetical protein